MTARVGASYPSYYKWVMLALFTGMNLIINFCQYQPSFFAQDIMDTFGVTSQSFTLMTSFPMAIGLFFAVAAGQVADRFGLRRTISVSLVVSALGCMARAFCSSYVPLLIMSMLLGFVATFCNANVTKMAMLWFPSKQVSMAVGIVTASTAAGLAAAQGLNGILFDDFYTAFFWGGVMLAVVWVLWMLFARDKVVPQSSEVPDEAAGDAAEVADDGSRGVKDVLKSRNLWIAGLGRACYNGYNVTAGSLLITALVVTWGTDAVKAGLMTSLFTVCAAIGAVVIPTWIVHVKRAKGVCIMLPLVSMGLVFAAWNINVDMVRFVLFPVAGFIFGAITPVLMSYPSILPEVNDQNSGSAGGMLISLGLVGGICVPSFIVTPIAGTDYDLMVRMICCIGALAAVAFALLPSVYAGREGE